MWFFTPAICPVDAHFCRPLVPVYSSTPPRRLCPQQLLRSLVCGPLQHATGAWRNARCGSRWLL